MTETATPFWIPSPGASRPDADTHTLTVGREPVRLPRIETGQGFTVTHSAPQHTQIMVTLVVPSDPLTPDQFKRGDRGRLCPAGETEFFGRVMRKSPDGGDHYVAWIKSGGGPVTLEVEIASR